MRFAAVGLALCAAASAIPVDTSAVDPSSVTGLVDTSTITKEVPSTPDLGARADVPDTSSVTGLVDTSAITKEVPSTPDLGARAELSDPTSVTNLVDTTTVTKKVPAIGVREITKEVTDVEGEDPLISILGAAPIATRNIVTNGGFPTTASDDSGLLEDLILEVRHIRFAIIKGIKDELKDIDPSLGREVSKIINTLNRTERELFRDVGLPGNIYHKLMIVIGEINSVVKTIEGGLIKETDIVDPSLASSIASLFADVNSLASNVDKIVGIQPASS